MRFNKGYTLIEVIVVLAIVMILAAVAVPALFGLDTELKQDNSVIEYQGEK